MARYLLDTDAVIDYLLGIPSTVQLIQALYEQGDTIGVCGAVVAEVYSGLRQEEQVGASRLLEHCSYLVTGLHAARQAGIWRRLYRQRGQSLAVTDALIAATARASSATLITGDTALRSMPEVEVLPLPRVGRTG
ncbi:MAG: PIN domain-containing protein [Chloroflexi bacterium]|nr:PIN domain-containing protein [Chloroflexota bacterium]